MPELNNKLSYNLSIEGQKEITLRLQVTNQSNQPLKVIFDSAQEYDFVINKDGKQVWRWSEGKLFTMAVKEKTIEPGAVVESVVVWSGSNLRGQKIERGQYDIQGYFLGNGQKIPVAQGQIKIS